MAEAVRHAIETGEHLAVQAGTGTGKSLAYLVPAVRHAVATSSTIVVATTTSRRAARGGHTPSFPGHYRAATPADRP